jgi:hypothetical protein
MALLFNHGSGTTINNWIRFSLKSDIPSITHPLLEVETPFPPSLFHFFELLVIGVGCVEGRHRVVAGDSVFGRQHGG